jgi:hypothetical protein
MGKDIYAKSSAVVHQFLLVVRMDRYIGLFFYESGADKGIGYELGPEEAQTTMKHPRLLLVYTKPHTERDCTGGKHPQIQAWQSAKPPSPWAWEETTFCVQGRNH